MGVLAKWGGGFNQTRWLWGPCWSRLGSQSPGDPMCPMASMWGVMLGGQGQAPYGVHLKGIWGQISCGGDTEGL